MNYLEFFYGPEQQRYDGHGEGERCCSESERDDGYVEDCRQDMTVSYTHLTLPTKHAV